MPQPIRLPSVLLAIALLLYAASSIAAAADDEPATAVATGKLPPEQAQQAAEQLGSFGCLVVGSDARREALLAKLASLGWRPPADSPLAKVDFGKQLLVFVFDCGDVGNQFALRKTGGDDKVRDVDLVMSYVTYKQRDRPVSAGKFIAVAVARAERVKVSVSSYHPTNGGPHPTPETARPEWSATLADDVVGGLRGRITPKAGAVRAGEDILVQFRLESAADFGNAATQFGVTPGPLFVWDGKYSNGYRNHAFHVQVPDGRTHFLRPEEIREWSKNAPHPVEVRADRPYVLPEWREGETHKSLKRLGLDTSKPGRYLITGVYAEAGGAAEWRGRPVPLWGGELWTNTVAVEVTGE